MTTSPSSLSVLLLRFILILSSYCYLSLSIWAATHWVAETIGKYFPMVLGAASPRIECSMVRSW